jgi:hypothetical protein
MRRPETNDNVWVGIQKRLVALQRDCGAKFSSKFTGK